MRPFEGSKPIDLSVLKKALEDSRVWCGLAKVVKRDGDASHFEIEKDDSGNPVDVLVEIDLMPDGIPILARLGSGFGGASFGVWRVPPVGTEVAWMAPNGELEADVMIVSTLSSGALPGAVDEDTLVVFNTKKIHVETNGGDIEIVASGQVKVQGGDQPVARKTDPVDLGKFSCSGLGSAFLGILWLPPNSPGGTTPTLIAASPTALTGAIKDGSTKFSSG